MTLSRSHVAELVNGIEQAAREIYYAMSLLKQSHPSRANLQLALKSLGVYHPMDVGLSTSVLDVREDKEVHEDGDDPDKTR